MLGLSLGLADDRGIMMGACLVANKAVRKNYDREIMMLEIMMHGIWEEWVEIVCQVCGYLG